MKDKYADHPAKKFDTPIHPRVAAAGPLWLEPTHIPKCVLCMCTVFVQCYRARV